MKGGKAFQSTLKNTIDRYRLVLVPCVSISTSVCWGFLALTNIKVMAGQVFVYITSVSGSVAYITWATLSSLTSEYAVVL
jgi:amino acid permease